ncbi:MAG: Ig-like domain-containing protein [Gemmatimonadota bacterium]|nr:Ig-like domain-containing protein [Gemmatimonadota bacterium]
MRFSRSGHRGFAGGDRRSGWRGGRASAGVAVVLSVACGSATEPGGAAALAVGPSRDTLEVGRQVVLTATLRDRDGNVITGGPVTWASSAPAVALVAGSGASATVTGVAPGTATITAGVDRVFGDAVLLVQRARSATGRWTGSGRDGARSYTFLLSVTEGPSGALTGAGTAQAGGGGADSLAVGGSRWLSDITVRMTVTGFAPFVFSGTYRDTIMTGSISGSGFDRLPTTFLRTSTTPAGRLFSPIGPAAPPADRDWRSGRPST